MLIVEDALALPDELALAVDDAAAEELGDDVDDAAAGGTFPTTVMVGTIVSLSMTHASMAPSVARMPQEMSPPSKAGPAEQAQLIWNSLLPKTSSPLVPRSINRLISGLFQIMDTRAPAVISPPT